MSVAEIKTAADLPDARADVEMRAIFDRQKAASLNAAPPSLADRRTALDRLLRLVLEQRDAVVRAISDDFGNRSRHETLLSEIFTVAASIKHTRKHLKQWMKTRAAPVGWQLRPGHASIIYQPLGVVGVIAPWNYPFQLALLPLAAALAAGNRVMLKPSELTPRTAELLERLLGQTFEPDQVAVVNGGPAVGEAFSRLPFDHLLYTGSTRVGHHIMRAAAENLTPVTLELGGKSPAIVGDYGIAKAAAAIAAGKLLNAGQTCIAPDYALVPAAQVDDFAAAVEQAARKLYPTLAENPDYTSIVNDRHYQRIKGYVDEARGKGARVVEINPAGEALPAEGRRLPPTLVIDPDDGLAVMQEEIFGPVLPIKGYGSLEEAVAYVNARPRPLALYYFGKDKRRRDMVLERTVAGGVTVNDTLAHFAVEDLPFGGVGASGMGQYHGYDGFVTFSKRKGVFYQSAVNGTPMLRPPYGRVADRMLKFLIGH